MTSIFVINIGTGWGGFQLAKDLDKTKFDVTVISPVNYFLFTPLLPSTTVGTLEYRCIQESIRYLNSHLHFLFICIYALYCTTSTTFVILTCVLSALLVCCANICRTLPDISYIQAKALSADFENKTLVCQDVYAKAREKEGGECIVMDISYDKLLISCGSKTNTFNTPGLYERENKEIFFLKHLSVSCLFIVISANSIVYDVMLYDMIMCCGVVCSVYVYVFSLFHV